MVETMLEFSCNTGMSVGLLAEVGNAWEMSISKKVAGRQVAKRISEYGLGDTEVVRLRRAKERKEERPFHMLSLVGLPI